MKGFWEGRGDSKGEEEDLEWETTEVWEGGWG